MHVITKPCLLYAELIATSDSIVVFLFSCVRQEVEGIVMVLSIRIATFSSLNLRVSIDTSSFLSYPLEEVTKVVQVSFQGAVTRDTIALAYPQQGPAF